MFIRWLGGGHSNKNKVIRIKKNIFPNICSYRSNWGHNEARELSLAMLKMKRFLYEYTGQIFVTQIHEVIPTRFPDDECP